MKAVRTRPAPSGFALATALGVTAALGLLAAAIAAIARTDVLVTRNVAGAARAHYLAEAGVAWTVAQLPPDWEAPIAPVPPFGETADVTFPSPPSHFTVTALAGATAAPDLRLVTTGFALDGTMRSLEFRVRRTRAPTSPGALVLGGDNARLDVAGSLVVDGRDHLVGDPALEPHGEHPPAHALTSRPGGGGEVSVSGTGRVTLLGRADPPSTGRAIPPDLAALASSLPRQADGVTWIPGPTRLEGATTLGGIVVVDGPLILEEPLEVTGLLAVRGTMTVRGGRVSVLGALWLAPPPRTTAVSIEEGELTVLYSVEALEMADGIAPLPRWPTVVAIRDRPG